MQPLAAQPERIVRLRELARPQSGMVPMVRCQACSHLVSFPVAEMLRRFGEQMPVDRIRQRMTCSQCGARRVEIRTMRLCDPGCARQRG